jgi:hypothetical protein
MMILVQEANSSCYQNYAAKDDSSPAPHEETFLFLEEFQLFFLALILR